MAEQDKGQMSPNDTSSQFNATAFQIKQWVQANVSTMKPVKVVAVYGPDGGELDGSAVTAIGYVDVQPLTKQMNSTGETMGHGIISRVPYVRAQGGKVAIVIDPKVGDVGHIVCADRDMSAVKANRGAESNPGSHRAFDPADGVFQGCFTGEDAPEAYIFWKEDHWLITPDQGETYIAIRPGEIVLWAKKVIVHGDELASFDAYGTGFEYRPAQIDNYTAGASTSSHPINPPAVPAAEAAEEE